MDYNRLFPQIEGMVHGGDYNPDQWLDHPEILEEDVKLMKQAHINCVSLGIFSWAGYEPREGEFHFDWMKDIIDRLYKNGIYTVLATPSGARPAWLDMKYEECRRVDKTGHREHHGVRHNHCMSSPVFRDKVALIVSKLYEAVGEHPGVIMWHLSNELGGECYCEKCVARFQEYLRDKFNNDITELNKAWWTTFWSHTYGSFEEIEPPYSNGEYSVMGLNLEWKRFTTWNMNDYVKFEIDTLRKLGSSLPVTTNFMQLYEGLDYHKMADQLDVISWDSYPRFHNDYETFEQTMARSAFDHAVMRSMKKDKPFMLMENAPGLVNWHEVNKLKRPYVHRLFSLQTIGCGSDTIQYFQIRKGRGAYEQYHGAVIDHVGTADTRTFKEVEALGSELEKLKEVSGSLVHAKAAMIFDWDCMWSIADARFLADETKKYPETCAKIYDYMMSFGMDVDVVGQNDDLSEYKIVVAPMLYMIKGDLAVRLKEYVEQGGQLLCTYVTGYVDENTLCFLGGFPGNGLKDLFGIVSEDIDTYYPSDENHVTMQDGKTYLVKDYAELLKVYDAQVLGTYDEDFYQGYAAVTKKKYGKGNAYYLAARLDEEGTKSILADMIQEADLHLRQLPKGVEYHERMNETKVFQFFLNMTNQPCEIKEVIGTLVEDGEEVTGTLQLDAFDVKIVETKRE